MATPTGFLPITGWAAKTETVENTAETLTAAEGIPVLSAEITPEIQTQDVRVLTPRGGRLGHIVVGRRASWAAEFPLYGNGLNAGNIVQPVWMDTFLQTVGAIDVTTDVSRADWVPNIRNPNLDGVAAKKTFTFGGWTALQGSLATGKKKFWRVGGCKIGRVIFTFRMGEPSKVRFEGLGFLDTTSTDPTTDISSWSQDSWVPSRTIKFDGAEVQVDSTSVDCSEITITIDFGAEFRAGDTNAAGAGVTNVELRAPEVNISANPIFVAQSDEDLRSHLQLATEIQFQPSNTDGLLPDGVSTNTGFGFTWAAPVCQIVSGAPDRSNPVRMPLELAVNMDDANSDEITLSLF